MEYLSVMAAKPGEQSPRLDKRTNDTRKFLVNCSTLLAKNELFSGPISVRTPVGSLISVDEIRPKAGNNIFFRVSGGPSGIVYADYAVVFTASTTCGNSLEVPVVIRAYSS